MTQLESKEVDAKLKIDYRDRIEGALAGHEVVSVTASFLIEADEEYYADLVRREPRLRGRKLDNPEYKYFTVLSSSGEKLGMIGIYHTQKDRNLTDTIVDPEYRGLGLARQFKDLLMQELDLPYLTMTIDYDPHAPGDPSRTNVNSLRAVQKLPGVQRIEDPDCRRNYKLKFLYPRRTQEAIDSDIALLESIKERIDRGGITEMTWREIRVEFSIPLNTVGDKSLILKTLGEGRLVKYFRALDGEAKPYKFPLPLNAHDLPMYLDYELSQTPAYFISDLLERPLSEAGVNILISHCIHVPGFTLSVIQDITEAKMNDFLARLIGQFPATLTMLGKVFGDERINRLKKLDEFASSGDLPPPGLTQQFRDFERSLFGKSAMEGN